MVVLSKYLPTGNKHLAKTQYLAQYRNSKKVFPRLSISDLFCSLPSQAYFHFSLACFHLS